ncbi:putative sulfate/molybdate transporter, partial [Thermodesulfobacteriota bacterium]
TGLCPRTCFNTSSLVRGELGGVEAPAFTLPAFTGFPLEAMWQTLLLAGLAQIPLTATNAVMSTSSLIKTYWPDREVKENTLAISNGVMNIALPLLGGMPLCHGAGGLAGKYYFGARTGGTNIIEGVIEIALGLLLAASIATLFTAFPMAIIGTMLLMVGIELCKFVGDVRGKENLVPLLSTVAVSLATNMALGFLTGLLIHHAIQRLSIEPT